MNEKVAKNILYSQSQNVIASSFQNLDAGTFFNPALVLDNERAFYSYSWKGSGLAMII